MSATTPSPAPLPATYSVTITLKDGSTATHTGEAIRYWHDSDGAVVVEAQCTCGLVGPDGKVEDTRSRHTFYDITGQPLGDGSGKLVVCDPEAEVRAHVQKVAEHHAAVHRVRSFTLDALMKPVS